MRDDAIEIEDVNSLRFLSALCHLGETYGVEFKFRARAYEESDDWVEDHRVHELSFELVKVKEEFRLEFVQMVKDLAKAANIKFCLFGDDLFKSLLVFRFDLLEG